MTTQDKHDNRVEVNGNGVTSLSGLVLKGYRPCAVCGTSVPVGNDYDGSPVMHGICEDSLNPSFCGECERFKATGFVTDDDGVQHRSCVECAAKGPDLGFDWLFTPDLQVRIDHEPTRDAIECRAQATGWSDPAPVACRALSGEILRSAQLTDTQGVIVFERKYGERPGYRTVVLTAPDASKPLVLVTNAFADAPKTTGNMERIKTFRDKNVLEAITAPAQQHQVGTTTLSPSDGISSQMTYTYHVRSYGDLRVICTTTTLTDAQRIVKALGNCGIWQFRNASGYDDAATWTPGMSKIGAKS